MKLSIPPEPKILKDTNKKRKKGLVNELIQIFR